MRVVRNSKSILINLTTAKMNKALEKLVKYLSVRDHSDLEAKGRPKLKFASEQEVERARK